MGTKVLTVHMPAALVDAIDKLAERLERPRAWVDREQERHRLTLEALADVDQGRVIGHQGVQAWADSL